MQVIGLHLCLLFEIILSTFSFHTCMVFLTVTLAQERLSKVLFYRLSFEIVDFHRIRALT
jgi:hypothetical protein